MAVSLNLSSYNSPNSFELGRLIDPTFKEPLDAADKRSRTVLADLKAPNNFKLIYLDYSCIYNTSQFQIIQTVRRIHYWACEYLKKTLNDRFNLYSGEKKLVESQVKLFENFCANSSSSMCTRFGIDELTTSLDISALVIENVKRCCEYIEIVSKNAACLYLQKEIVPHIDDDKHEDFLKYFNERLYDEIISQIRGSGPDYEDVIEAIYLELIASNLVYCMPKWQAKLGKRWKRFLEEQIYAIKIKGYDKLIPYKLSKEYDLWHGLTAYMFEPNDKLLKKMGYDSTPPDIFAIKGTQRNPQLEGFGASMLSIWNPRGPGENALINFSGIKAWFKRYKGEVILTGHSMGGQIAASLVLEQTQCIKKVRIFSDPGRNKQLIRRLAGISDNKYETYQTSQQLEALQAAKLASSNIESNEVALESDVIDAIEALRLEEARLEEIRKKIHHYVHPSDPVVGLGHHRIGRVWLVDTGDAPFQWNLNNIIKQGKRLLQHFHSTPLLAPVNRDHYLVFEVPEKVKAAPHTPLTGIVHLFVSHHIYGPIKACIAFMGLIGPCLILLSYKIRELTHYLFPPRQLNLRQ